MDTRKWKSVAVDIENYKIITAMGEKGFRRPGAMIAKLVDSELKIIAKKQGKSTEKLKAELLLQGSKKLNGK
jgi:hypothetical protein|tara:strand:+ start:119 stop:334 length:216 start_codon:yes stop_codon:yes gene_type:complete